MWMTTNRLLTKPRKQGSRPTNPFSPSNCQPKWRVTTRRTGWTGENWKNQKQTVKFFKYYIFEVKVQSRWSCPAGQFYPTAAVTDPPSMLLLPDTCRPVHDRIFIIPRQLTLTPLIFHLIFRFTFTNSCSIYFLFFIPKL